MKIRPQQKNANKHTEHGTRLLEKSLQQDGWIDAQTVAADGEMISGSARLEVAADKFADVEPILVESDGTRPVVVVRTDIPNADDPRAKRLSIAANQIAHTDWNPDAELLKEWGNEDKDIKAMFADSEWREITGEEKPVKDTEPQIDRAAELLEKWQVKTGDMFAIGKHRLICGDCTDAAIVARVMGGERAELAFTSPPYLEMREYSGNDLTLDKLLFFVDVMVPVSNYQAVNLGLKFTDGEVVPYWDEYIKKFYSCGLKLLAWNVWDKTMGGSIASATNMFLLTHEFIFVFGKKRKELNRTIPNQMEKYEKRHGKDFLEKGTRKGVRQADASFVETTSKAYTHHQLHSVLQQTPELGNVRSDHPAIFPVGFPYAYIEAMTNSNDVVYDPFSGSGTTLIACQRLGRYGRACEISPAYVAVALERMSQAFPELEIKRVE